MGYMGSACCHTESKVYEEYARKRALILIKLGLAFFFCFLQLFFLKKHYEKSKICVTIKDNRKISFTMRRKEGLYHELFPERYRNYAP